MPDNKSIKDKEQADRDKLEAEKLEQVIIYTVEYDMIKFTTENKNKAFEIWHLLAKHFFQLKELGDRYDDPHFKYRDPIVVKLTAETIDIWKDNESAQRAHMAYEAMRDHAVKLKKDDNPF